MFIPDSFGNGSLTDGVLSRIGGREVKVTDVERDTQRLIDEVRATENRNTTPADAAREGRVQGIIQDIEVRNTLLAYADKTGVQASDASLKPYPRAQQAACRRVRQAEPRPVALSGSPAPSVTARVRAIHQGLPYAGLYPRSGGCRFGSAGDPVAAFGSTYLGESRTFSLAQVNAATAPGPCGADRSRVAKSWYDAHKANFQQPERRRISVLTAYA